MICLTQLHLIASFVFMYADDATVGRNKNCDADRTELQMDKLG